MLMPLNILSPSTCVTCSHENNTTADSGAAKKPRRHICIVIAFSSEIAAAREADPAFPRHVCAPVMLIYSFTVIISELIQTD